MAYRTFMRHKNRVAAGQPALRKRSPSKVEFDFHTLENELRDLTHGPCRTAGLGELHARFSQVISRAGLRDLAAAVRAEQLYTCRASASLADRTSARHHVGQTPIHHAFCSTACTAIQSRVACSNSPNRPRRRGAA